MIKIPLHHFACTLAAAILPTPVIAGTITWGVQMQEAADFDVFSDGNIITDQRFGYELGVFAPAFTPIPGNTPLWDANWERIGERTPLDAFTGNYGGMMETGSLVAAGTGRQVYIWGDQSRTPGENLEWVLYTSNEWTAVESNDDLIWEPASAGQAIVGRIATTDPATAGGMISRPVILGDNAIQTAAIPEPRATTLLLLSLSACALRRARPATPAAAR